MDTAIRVGRHVARVVGAALAAAWRAHRAGVDPPPAAPPTDLLSMLRAAVPAGAVPAVYRVRFEGGPVDGMGGTHLDVGQDDTKVCIHNTQLGETATYTLVEKANGLIRYVFEKAEPTADHVHG